MSESPPAIDQLTEFDGLKSLVVEGFYLVIKFVPESEFSEINLKRNLSNLKWLDDNAREHISVIIRVSENCTVIPFKFGTVYHSTDSIKDFVRDYSTSLIENFNKTRGKEEWSVKIYYNRTVLSRQIDELSEEAAALEKQIIASSPGKAFLLKRKKTDLIETEMDRLCKKYGQAYFDEFKSSSVDSTLENLIPKEYTGRDDTMILNANFLVEKEKVHLFTNVVENLRKKDGNTGFFIETTGPWPAFSFVSIKVK
jgi:hypothetical protein